MLLSGCKNPNDTVWNSGNIHSTAILLDENGKKIWSDMYGNHINKYGYSGIGFHAPNKGYVRISYDLYYATNFSIPYYYMIRSDSLGKTQWVRYFGDTTRYDNIMDGIEINDSTYLLVGSICSKVDYSNDYLHVTKVNSSGKVLMEKDFLGGIHAAGSTIRQTFDGKFVICSPAADDSSYYATNYRTVVIKIDENLNYDTFNLSLKYTYDSLCPHKITNGDTIHFPRNHSVVRVDTMSFIQGIENENQFSQFKIKIYPDPVENILQVRFPEGIDHGDISIIDLSGKLIKNQKAVLPESYIDVSVLPHGMYIIKIRGKEGVWNGKFMKM